jgi:hypothetical protein
MSSTNRAATPRVRATPGPRKTVAPAVIEAAAPDSRQAVMLATDGRGNLIVSVHVKRTYQLLPTGECRIADEQAPFLSGEPTPLPPEAPAGTNPDDNVFPELDIIPHKLATDLIVMASAHARAGKPIKRMIAGIDCGELQHRKLVQGDRRSYVRPDGQIGFTDAEPFQVMPLRYERAYGGCDPTTPVPPIANLLDAMLPHPGIYPRNPAGRGYAVTGNRDHVEGLPLPNIESPRDALTPARLVSGAAENWWRQPLPWCCDWFDASWYPRSVHLGGVPEHLPDDDTQMEEVRLGWVAAGQRARFAKAGMADLFDARFSDAASPGMVLPFLHGDETVRLLGMTPSGELSVRLPGRPPRIAVRAAGKVNEVQPVANRILISTDEMGVYVVWHGAWPCPKRTKDLSAIDVFVDNRKLEPAA